MSDSSTDGLHSTEFVVYSNRCTTNQGLQLEEGSVVGPLPFLLGARSLAQGGAEANGDCCMDDWLTLRGEHGYTLALYSLSWIKTKPFVFRGLQCRTVLSGERYQKWRLTFISSGLGPLLFGCRL